MSGQVSEGEQADKGGKSAGGQTKHGRWADREHQTNVQGSQVWYVRQGRQARHSNHANKGKEGWQAALEGEEARNVGEVQQGRNAQAAKARQIGQGMADRQGKQTW